MTAKSKPAFVYRRSVPDHLEQLIFNAASKKTECDIDRLTDFIATDDLVSYPRGRTELAWLLSCVLKKQPYLINEPLWKTFDARPIDDRAKLTAALLMQIGAYDIKRLKSLQPRKSTKRIGASPSQRPDFRTRVSRDTLVALADEAVRLSNLHFPTATTLLRNSILAAPDKRDLYERAPRSDVWTYVHFEMQREKDAMHRFASSLLRAVKRK